MTKVMAGEAFASSVTPSGIEIEFHVEPKRFYRARWAEDKINDPSFSNYEGAFDWVVMDYSVSEILDVLDKPALPWWGMRVGIEGTLAMHNMSLVKSTIVETGPGSSQPALVVEDDWGAWKVAGVPEIEALLTKHKLTTNHVRDTAGQRGASVHDAFEVWAKTGKVPDIEMFPPSEQGYVVGLVTFLEDSMLQPESSEVMVASMQHGFAGRYDLRGRFPEEREVVFHRTPVRGAQKKIVKPGSCLLDLKTSKDVYESHCLQLEGYEGASIEDGYDPTDYRGVILVDADGNYKLVQSWATYNDFLAVLAVKNAFTQMKARKKEMK